jgi:7,8-dihydropterin-6-yl-methyl-4-(beta-D-ribofuranosyl)aminobenzene 5'-phosphate synthase
MPAVKICVLSDNKPGPDGFGSEHGLSMLIALGSGHRWLWDVGQSPLFLESAGKLGLDLRNTKGLALSHGHYDHTDGLATLFQEAGFEGPVFAHPGFAEQRYKSQQGSVPRPIGFNRDSLPWLLPRFTAVHHHRDLDQGLSMLSDIPRIEGHFQSVAGYFFDRVETIPDSVQDDACLVAHTNKGAIVVLGCCHSGLANTLHRISDVLGLKAIHAVLGGLHLLTAPESALHETVGVLREYRVERVHPCHCTGEQAGQFLKEYLPGKVFDVGTGTVIEF